MDAIYTGDSDDDGRNGDNELQSGDRKLYETVDNHTTEDSDILQRTPVNALITIGTEMCATSPMLLCHLGATELYDSLTTYAGKYYYLVDFRKYR